MNQTQSYMDMHPGPHISSGSSFSHSAPSQYSQYQQSQAMAAPSAYHAPGTAYNYPFQNNVTSPQSAGPQISHNLPLPTIMPGASAQPSYASSTSTAPQPFPTQQPMDTTGQIAPPGMKPRVTATLWEDEGSLCFQVEAKGVCVARREDNHFINGTKLLNVAGMTRGRRDGILKSEKVRHVVKIGPMHLKGVWIPFDRALEFANKEKITDILYPLFVHNIGGLLYNPENASRSTAVLAAEQQRRRVEGSDSSRTGQQSQAPPMQHHHSLQGNVGGPVSTASHPGSSHSAAARPNLDRAHTFPTPPTNTSSVMALGTTGNSYGWSGQDIPSAVNGTQPLSIDTGLNNARSMPTTPATTPPGTNVQSMPAYQQHHGFDSKHFYATTPSSQNGYPSSATNRFDSFKSEMGPPTAPGTGNQDPTHHEPKSEYATQHPLGSEAGHDSTYSSTPATYSSSRAPFPFHSSSDHQQLSPEMTSSPSHQNASGRGTPRTMQAGQPQWSQDYQTPPRSANQSGVYNQTSASNGTGSLEHFSSSSYSNPANKRRREDDEQDLRVKGRDYPNAFDPKRQKMGRPDTFGMPLTPNSHMQAIKTGGPIPGR